MVDLVCQTANVVNAKSRVSLEKHSPALDGEVVGPEVKILQQWVVQHHQRKPDESNKTQRLIQTGGDQSLKSKKVAYNWLSSK